MYGIARLDFKLGQLTSEVVKCKWRNRCKVNKFLVLSHEEARPCVGGGSLEVNLQDFMRFPCKLFGSQ